MSMRLVCLGDAQCMSVCFQHMRFVCLGDAQCMSVCVQHMRFVCMGDPQCMSVCFQHTSVLVPGSKYARTDYARARLLGNGIFWTGIRHYWTHLDTHEHVIHLDMEHE